MKTTKKLSVILLMIMGVMFLFTGCFWNKPNSKNNTNLTGESTLTKEEKDKATSITKDFAKAKFSVNYKTDDKETYQKWILMLDELGASTFDDEYINSNIEKSKTDTTIYSFNKLTIDSISKDSDIINVEATVIYEYESPSEFKGQKGELKLTLSINSEGKISYFDTKNL